MKKLSKILLLSTMLSLNPTEVIAPEINYLTIEESKPIVEDKRKIIILDPGHGMGNRVKGVMDWGKTYLGYKEAEIMLEKAEKIKNLLDSAKYNVVLTRRDNSAHSPVESRPELANKINGDIFLSLHMNSYKNWKSISGSEIYWRYKESKDLANLAAKNLKEIASINNRGVIKEEYLMLKYIKCPAVLIELGYLPNNNDRDKVTNTDLTEKAIVKTIEDYFKETFNQPKSP